MDAPRYRHRQRWPQENDDDFFDPIEERSAFREYSPIVFGGIMLVAAFAFAGHQIGRNASAHTSGVAQASLEIPALSQSSSIQQKSSLLPEDQTFQQMNLKLLRRQTVLSDGKGDLLILDPGAAPEALEKTVPLKKRVAAADNRIKIQPAAFTEQDEEAEKAEDAKKIAKKLALAPKPAKAEVEKKLALSKAEKKKVLAQRRLRAAEENCLARAIYFEARSESEMGQMAVAKVIMNRVKSPDYPKSICGVVYQGSQRRNSCQFSFACDGLPDDVKSPAAWANAKKVANKVINGDYKLGSGMNQATNYHADYVRPKWARNMRKIVKIGTHVFYSGG